METDVNSNTNISSFKKVTNLVIIVISLFMGFVINFFLDKYSPEIISNYKKGYIKRLNETQDITTELNKNIESYISEKSIEEINSGNILSVNKDQIIIQYKDLNGRYLNLVYAVSPETEAVNQVIKSKEIIDKELSIILNEKLIHKNNSTTSVLYNEVKINLSDLKIGDYVTFETLPSNKDNLILIKKISLNYNLIDLK